MGIPALQDIVVELPLLKSPEEREKFMAVVGALTLRWISLSKASEVMGMPREELLGVLDALGVDYSYLTDEDVETERS